MGEAVRELARENLGPEATSHEIGHWATVSREVNGPEIMAKRLVTKWREGREPDTPVHIEGVRSIHEVAAFDRLFTFVPIIFVDAPFGTRLSRLNSRGRDGEDAFDVVDLVERDNREAEWGVRQIRFYSQYTLPNDDDISTLRNRLDHAFECLID